MTALQIAMIKKQLECVHVSHLVPISSDEDDEEEYDKEEEEEGSVGMRWRDARMTMSNMKMR